MVLQSGHANPRWPPKWPLEYLTCNLDGLESHRVIKGCKTIPEVGVAIRSPESKMAAKMDAKMAAKIFNF